MIVYDDTGKELSSRWHTSKIYCNTDTTCCKGKKLGG